MSIFCAFSLSQRRMFFMAWKSAKLGKQPAINMKILHILWIKQQSQNNILGSKSNSLLFCCNFFAFLFPSVSLKKFPPHPSRCRKPYQEYKFDLFGLWLKSKMKILLKQKICFLTSMQGI